MRFITSLLVVLVAAIAAVYAQAPVRPIFPESWSANEYAVVIQPNGPTQEGSSQAHYLQGKNGNMTALFAENGQSFVADFDQQVVYFIDYYHNCQYWCPLQQDTVCDSQLNGDSLCSYDYLHSAKFVQQTTIDNIPVNEFAWQDFLGPIAMASRQFYVDSETNAPVQLKALFTPFGNLAANVTLTYSNFTAGEPDPSVWNVGRAQYCQTDEDQCQNVNAVHRNTLNRLLMMHRFFKNTKN